MLYSFKCIDTIDEAQFFKSKLSDSAFTLLIQGIIRKLNYIYYPELNIIMCKNKKEVFVVKA